MDMQQLKAAFEGRAVDGNLDFRSFLDVIAAVFEDGALTVEDKEPLIAFAEEAFEEYVRDFDIPGVPTSSRSTSTTF